MNRTFGFSRAVSVSVVVLLSMLISSRSWGDTYPRQTGVDVLHYVFELAVSDDSPEIEGKTSVTLRSAVDGLEELQLDLGSLDGESGMRVSAVSENGEPLEFTHQYDRLAIKLAAPAQAGQERTVSVEYRGQPRTGLRLGENMHGEWCVFSENFPDRAREWLATIDHPYDKATGEFIVTAPARYQVVANGLLVDETDLPNDRRRTQWRQSVPICTWLYALGVARFSVAHYGTADSGAGHDVPLQGWVYPQNRESGHHNFDETGRSALEFFTQHVGPYPYEKLAHVQAAGIGGGTEHATAIFYGERHVLRENRGLVVHEVAHQWFGNSVTEEDWDDVWLSEGFATYFTNLYFEHHEGREEFVERMQRDRARVLRSEGRRPDTPIVHRNISNMREVLNIFVYQKAGWFLHMLRRQVGDEAFWKGIRAYYAKYRDANASTADFLAVMEEASGQELGWLFDQWLSRGTSPRLQGEWSYDADAGQVKVALRQAQEGAPYRLPLEIAVASDGNQTQRLHAIELTGAEGEFALPSESVPYEVMLDPNVWVLMYEPEFARRTVAD